MRIPSFYNWSHEMKQSINESVYEKANNSIGKTHTYTRTLSLTVHDNVPWERASEQESVCVCMCVCAHVCVCACVCVHTCALVCMSVCTGSNVTAALLQSTWNSCHVEIGVASLCQAGATKFQSFRLKHGGTTCIKYAEVLWNVNGTHRFCLLSWLHFLGIQNGMSQCPWCYHHVWTLFNKHTTTATYRTWSFFLIFLWHCESNFGHNAHFLWDVA